MPITLRILMRRMRLEVERVGASYCLTISGYVIPLTEGSRRAALIAARKIVG